MNNGCRFFFLFLACILSTVTHGENLVIDPDFHRGFDVMSPQRDVYTDRVQFEKVFPYDDEAKNIAGKALVPAWRLVQWGSGHSIANAVLITTADGEKRWTLMQHSASSDQVYKRVALSPIQTSGIENAGKNDLALTLELNGLTEFNAHYLTNTDEYWPHLLMVQNIKTQKLSAYSSLYFMMDARLLFDEQNLHDGYQKDIHAGRFVVSFAIHNTLSGNSFWLNLPIYDDRFPETNFGCQKCDKNGKCSTPQMVSEAGQWMCPFDGERWSATSTKKGTRRMIFRVPTHAITQADIRQHQWTHYEVDLLPYIQAGMEAAQNQEHLQGFLPSLKYFDITLLSLGWEITGLNHASMEIRNLSLQAEKTETPK